MEASSPPASSSPASTSSPPSLSTLPDDELRLILEACDLPTNRLARALDGRFCRLAREVVRSAAFRALPANLEALRLAAWRESGPAATQLEAHQALSTVYGVSLENGGTLASAGSDGTVTAWRLGRAESRADEGVCARRLHRWTELAARSVAVLGERVAFGCEDGTVHLTTPAAPGGVRALKGHKERVTCLCWSEGRLVSGGLDRALRVWDVGRSPGTLGAAAMRAKEPREAARSPVGTYLLAHTRPVRALAAGEGSLFLSGGDDGKIHVWRRAEADDLPTLHATRRVPGEPSGVVAVAVGYGRGAAASADGQVVTWDLSRRQWRRSDVVVPPGSSAGAPTTALAFGAPQTLISAGGRDKRAVCIWDLRCAAEGRGPTLVATLPHMAAATACAARGGVVVSGDSAGIVRLWRCRPHELVA